MTTLLMVILHDLTHMPEILDSWKKIGVPGVTILHSIGGFQASELVRKSGLVGFLKMFEEVRSSQRTLFSLIDDQALLEQAISEADRVVKGFDRPRSGILFTLPIDQVLGLQKWNSDSVAKETELETLEDDDHSKSNLLNWLKEDISAKYGEEVSEDWSQERSLQISKIMDNPDKKPILIRMDQPLPQILASFIDNPNDNIACVVNNEDRLMGLIDVHTLADRMFIPVIPEEYIENPAGYEQALEFADPSKLPVAAEIIQDPVYVHPEDNLEKAFHLMKENDLPGLPVVDKNYRVKGFISMLELMRACFINGT
ncbi:MAG: CBS domain-containing protein [Anaerolineales bacterium]